MSILFFSTLLASIGGFIVLTYQSYAQMQGWSVGSFFKNTIFQLLFGGLAIIGSVWTAYDYISLFVAFVVLIGGFILAFTLSSVFKSKVQLIAIILVILSYSLQFFI